VSVDAVSGIAGLIWPGDHVDVIMTQISDDPTLPASRRASAQTVLSDVRVIAIDKQLMQEAAGSATEQQDTAHTVTIEVTDVQAGRMALASRLGHLSLNVRAADAAPDTAGRSPPTTWGGDVSPALNERRAGRVMRVYQGTTDGKELKF